MSLLLVRIVVCGQKADLVLCYAMLELCKVLREESCNLMSLLYELGVREQVSIATAIGCLTEC